MQPSFGSVDVEAVCPSTVRLLTRRYALRTNAHTGMTRFSSGEMLTPKRRITEATNPTTASHLGMVWVRRPIIVVDRMKTAPIRIA